MESHSSMMKQNCAFRDMVDAFERCEQADPRLDARLRSKRTEIIDDARADGVDAISAALAFVRQRAEVDVDDIVGSEVRHSRRVAGHLQPLEQRSRVLAAREEARQHLRVDRLAEPTRTRDADISPRRSRWRERRGKPCPSCRRSKTNPQFLRRLPWHISTVTRRRSDMVSKPKYTNHDPAIRILSQSVKEQ